jgi:predicted TIM-barrel fold metal-dependent hydrolase
MNPTAVEAAQRLGQYLEDHANRLVIDADIHITDLDTLTAAQHQRYQKNPDYYHGRPISAEDAIREMDMAGVDMALAWQNPATTVYSGSMEANTRVLTEANRYVLESARRYPDRFIPAGWVDAKACGLDKTLDLVQKMVVEFGFLIVKLNPAQNGYQIDGPLSLAVVDQIVATGAIPAFHFGADTPYTPPEGLRCLAARHPERPLIAVHMGGGGASYLAAEHHYREARKLGLEFPNIRYVFSAKRDTHIESDLIAYQLAGEPFRRNLFCASDAPYGRMTWNFGGFRSMFASLIECETHTDPRVRARPGLFSPETARDYLGGNFARFAAGEYARLLGASSSWSARCP